MWLRSRKWRSTMALGRGQAPIRVITSAFVQEQANQSSEAFKVGLILFYSSYCVFSSNIVSNNSTEIFQFNFKGTFWHRRGRRSQRSWDKIFRRYAKGKYPRYKSFQRPSYMKRILKWLRAVVGFIYTTACTSKWLWRWSYRGHSSAIAISSANREAW